MAGNVKLEWEAPPPKETRRAQGLLGEILSLLDEVKKKPNTWAKLAQWDTESGAYNTRSRLRQLGHAEWKDGGRFEFEVRRFEKKGSGLWARYVVKTP